MSTYYVSSFNGNDANDGLSESSAFGSLFKINSLKLKAGDKVLLEKDSIFEHQYLHISARGSKESPILVSSYGSEGSLPIIKCCGGGTWYQDYGRELDSKAHTFKGYVSSAVLLYDCEYIEVEGLEISNKPVNFFGESYNQADKMNRTGVAVIAKNCGTLHDISLKNLYIHDVEGNVYDKHMNNGGIYATALTPDDEQTTGVARYDGFTIEGCTVRRVSRWGIAMGYTYEHDKFLGAYLENEPFRKYGHENVVIKNNYVCEAGGDAITVMYALTPLVEHNTADSVATEMNDRAYKYPEKRSGKVAAGIWPWKCKDALFRYNEVTDTKLNQDGMAYDADSGDGTVYEYNYSRLNEGGCVMFCLEEAVNNTFRHNLSVDDLGGTISPAGNPDAYIAENEFYVREGTPFLRKNMSGGKYELVDNKIEVIRERD